MATIINASIDVTKINKDNLIEGKKGKYLPITIKVNDESRYGQNVSIAESQSKEERDAEEPKNFIGNGSVVWTDGNISKAQKDDEPTDDVPF